MAEKIKVAVVDKNQSYVFGYMYCLNDKKNIQVVGSTNYGEDIDILLSNCSVDVLLMDINIPTNNNNPNPYPFMVLIPRLLEKYPNLIIVVISNECYPATIKAIMDAGVSGYILKEDNQSICNLGEIIQTVYGGDIHFSQEVFQELFGRYTREPTITKRQLQALTLCAAYPDETTGDLAARLGIANSTFRNLLSKTYFTLGVRNRTSAIAEARRLGWIPSVTSNNWANFIKTTR